MKILPRTTRNCPDTRENHDARPSSFYACVCIAYAPLSSSSRQFLADPSEFTREFDLFGQLCCRACKTRDRGQETIGNATMAADKARIPPSFFFRLPSRRETEFRARRNRVFALLATIWKRVALR